MTNFAHCNLSKFRFTPCHIIDFVQPDGLGGILKQFFLQRPNQKKKIQGAKPKMTNITWGKALLTLSIIFTGFF